MNYFEQLLGKISDAEARQQLQDLAGKHTEISQWVADPEDVNRAQQFNEWADTNWDHEHNMTRLEFQQQAELESLKTREKSNGMELDQLNEFLGKYIKDNGLLTRTEVDAQIKAKEDAFNTQLGVVSTLATRIPFLNARHQKDFGDLFDPDEFLKQADEKGYARYGTQGLDKFYDEYTSDKRAAKTAADIQSQIDAARADERKKTLAERGMGPGGQIPAIDGSPEMGHFQARLMGLNKPPVEGQTSAPPEAELGRGQIARFAAAAADAKDRAGLVQ